MTTVLKAVRMVLNVVFGALLVALLASAIAIVVIPACFSGTNLTVLTGSMEPGIMPGDIVVTRGVDSTNDSNLSIGDVIAFLPYPDDPTVVTHRIVGITVKDGETYYVTKGDNNNSTDQWGPVAASHVRGLEMYVIPKLGYVKQWFGSHSGGAVVAAGVLLIGYGVVTFGMSFWRPKEEYVPKRRWSEDDAD